MSGKKAKWYVYIVECSDKTLYTGVATDVKRRVKEHNESARGAKYVKGRRPVKLVYYFKAKSKKQALREEYKIKKLPKKKKTILFCNA